jgi:site-specific DNA-methyltransferase (adenine-specific)
MDVVTIGRATLYCGDCFDILPKLDVIADAVISDPPFGITACKWDKPIPLDTLWSLLERQTKQNANYVLFGCGMFAVELINSKSAWYRYDLVWQKNNLVGFLNANLQPLRSHEQILVFGRPGYQKSATYHAQKIPGGRTDRRVDRSRRAGTVYGACTPAVRVSDGTSHPTSVLPFGHDRGNNQQGLNQHPTQKPVALMQWLVRSYANVGDVVLDPFMGSGTTGVACVCNHRHFIGIERERQYFDIACQRIEKAEADEKSIFPAMREETKELF